MRLLIFLCWTMLVFSNCQSQTKSVEDQKVGGPCEGCEAIYEYGTQTLNAVDTLPNFKTTDPKLKVSGTIYQQDGKTPAKDVILYIYHTNRDGIYEAKPDASGWAQRHGHIRGWLKTGVDGRYTFYTFRPGAYPGGQEPEHIHLTVKEPGKREYYIESIHFEDDPLLTTAKREKMKQRGGSGITQAIMKNGILQLQRDIILGMNIPGYEP